MMPNAIAVLTKRYADAKEASDASASPLDRLVMATRCASYAGILIDLQPQASTIWMNNRDVARQTATHAREAVEIAMTNVEAESSGTTFEQRAVKAEREAIALHSALAEAVKRLYMTYRYTGTADAMVSDLTRVLDNPSTAERAWEKQ